MTRPYGSAVPSLPTSDSQQVGPRMPWQLSAAIALLFLAGARTFLGIVMALVSIAGGNSGISILEYLRPLLLVQTILALATIGFAVAGLLIRNVAVWVGLLVTAAGGSAVSIWQTATGLLSSRTLEWGSPFLIRILAGALIGLAPLVVATILLLMLAPRRYLTVPALAEGVRQIETRPGVVLAAQIIAGIIAAISTVLTVIAIAALAMADGWPRFAGMSGMMWGAMLPGVLPSAIAYAVGVFALGARRDWARVGLIAIVLTAVAGQLVSLVWALDVTGLLTVLVSAVIGGIVIALLAQPAARAWCDH